MSAGAEGIAVSGLAAISAARNGDILFMEKLLSTGILSDMPVVTEISVTDTEVIVTEAAYVCFVTVSASDTFDSVWVTAFIITFSVCLLSVCDPDVLLSEDE